VVTLFFLAVLAVASVLLAARSAATGEPGRDLATRTVVVAKGDTLWDIAGAAAGPGEIREMVHRIETLNALPGPELVEGQELAVPLR
jgi:nucleoid-associated protein YgaU